MLGLVSAAKVCIIFLDFVQIPFSLLTRRQGNRLRPSEGAWPILLSNLSISLPEAAVATSTANTTAESPSASPSLNPRKAHRKQVMIRPS